MTTTAAAAGYGGDAIGNNGGIVKSRAKSVQDATDDLEDALRHRPYMKNVR